ncbi:RT0821/Lpp0805 family surface protein [Mesorhizobium xinjiangense]|uniref:RT0821/Lpp0805 family surface protein n=1 Tax=Mesorhizobium xinjiangense TaxID=2678685 RepID=UPI0018DE77B8|nr:RT0821/Lpp0805 family surface protein [Mesorhizobium xinjiangense]
MDSITTGSIAAPAADDEGEISDSAVVREALSSVPDGRPFGEAIAWTNSATGSVGDIRVVTEHRNGGVLCRSFTTSRETFSGVSLYYGESCRTPSGAWWMKRFEPA